MAMWLAREGADVTWAGVPGRSTRWRHRWHALAVAFTNGRVLEALVRVDERASWQVGCRVLMSRYCAPSWTHRWFEELSQVDGDTR